MWPHGGDSGANGISRMSIENPCFEFLRRIMIAGEEPCVLSAPKGKPRRGCATAGFPAPGPTGDRNYWGRQGNAPAPPVFRDARYATPNPAEAHRRWRGGRASRSGSVSATHTL